MDIRKRVVAAASAGSVLAALVTGATAAGSEGAQVKFSSKPAVSRLLAHYVVSPTEPGDRSESSTEAGQSGSVDRSSPAANSSNVQRSSQTLKRASRFPARKNADAPSAAVSSGAGIASESRESAADNAGTPSPTATFIGQQASATTCSYFAQGCNPPDMALAASPEFVLQGVNTQWQTWDTSGNVQPGWPVSAQQFFRVPNVTRANGTPCDVAHQSQPFLSDPRALFDPIDGRFWAAMLQIENGFGIAPDCPFLSVYFIAVSQTSDPTGDWNVYEFEMSLNKRFSPDPKVAAQIVGADFTQLGIDGQAIYFSANMFTQDGNFYAWAEVFEANKAKMESGQGGFTAAGFFDLQATGPGTTPATGPFVADTVQPAVNLDGSANGVETFVNTLDGPDPVNGNFCGQTGLQDPCSGLALWRLANPTAHDRGGPLPTLTGRYVPTRPYLINNPANQPSCNQCVDANDLRIPATPQVSSGVLYTAWGTAINNGTQVVPGIEWAQVSLSGSDVQQAYYFQSGDTAVTYPAMMPDGQGNVLMLFERMGHNVFPEVRYIKKGADDDNFSGVGAQLKAGESSYRPERCGTLIPVCRWGDFEAASFDGQGRIWIAGEYANQYMGLGGPVFVRNWGTWIGAIG